MALREIEMKWMHIRTYATEAALRKRIAQDADLYPEHDDRYIVVRTPEGRWTAIVITDKRQGGYLRRTDFVHV